MADYGNLTESKRASVIDSNTEAHWQKVSGALNRFQNASVNMYKQNGSESINNASDSLKESVEAMSKIWNERTEKSVVEKQTADLEAEKGNLTLNGHD